MFLLDAAAILLCLAALFGLLNHHVLRLPFAIGLMLSGLMASFATLAIDALWPSFGIAQAVRGAILEVDFSAAVLSGMLSLLLFAGALHTDLARLRSRALPIALLATLGVCISTAVAGLLAKGIFGGLGLEVPWMWCFVFGALISPTDPIAVLGVMKKAGAPPALEIKVIGESLFNDGTGVVVFTVLLGLASASAAGGETSHWASIASVLWNEVGGGVLLGLAAGWLCYRAMRSLDEPNLEILISLATVFAIGFCAARLHASAPLAAVVAGLFVGNHGRAHGMSPTTQTALDTVWTFIDEALNALLFLLIGIEVFAIDWSEQTLLLAAPLGIAAHLLARFLGVALPLGLIRRHVDLGAGAVRVLTWGGLKGGISIALAMKTPPFPGRDAVLATTYAIVVFSILVQGLTLAPVIRRVTRSG
jgi:CPA1 family monovalent cation:H+ antiporter